MFAENTQIGRPGLIGMRGCETLSEKIDYYLKDWNVKEDGGGGRSVLMNYDCPRFSTGEAKGMIRTSVRGFDLYILADVFNYGVTYKMYGMDVPMSPDDHFADLKRIIAATNGKTRRLTVIMPLLYEGRQHRRFARESLDCAMALQELAHMGVNTIITFDAHDARVQNAIPLKGFENVRTTYQMIRELTRTVDNLDLSNTMIVSPDEGGMPSCIYYSSVLGIDLGMFYKRRDYTKVINGRNPIISHEFLGDRLDGKDVILIDDIIASGDSVLSILRKIKDLGARRTFVFATFGQFCGGLEDFDKAYEEGLVERVYTSNLIYQPQELLNRKWYCSVDMSKYIAHLIRTLNFDRSLSSLLDPSARIEKLLSSIKK
ncbi:MAG: ribose-phosphate pyrophosphokinase [Oscillospiraceae bacterium]|nr:ribose-phosphate pyrophosphokinase [Oscillospiraceae bacterium]